MTGREGLNLVEIIQDNAKAIVFKIIPRIIISALLSFLFASIDNYASLNEVIAFFILFCFITFYFLPFNVDTLYALKKTGDVEFDEITYMVLLRASKDNYNGIFKSDDSLVIKSYSEKAVKYYEKLKEKYGFAGYEIIRADKSKKAFKEEYYKLLDKYAMKNLEGIFKLKVKEYNIRDLDRITL
jgi:hypothetical protein